MKLTLKTAHGYLSFQPDGRIEYRDRPGDWETIEMDMGLLPIVSGEPVAPAPPPAPGTGGYNFDVPYGMALDDATALRQFIGRGLLLAYGRVVDGTVTYWINHADEMRARGLELGMHPPERYFWERIIGRGSGGDAIASFGPYAGRSESQESLTPWP
jgi:hypothetical protein